MGLSSAIGMLKDRPEGHVAYWQRNPIMRQHFLEALKSATARCMNGEICPSKGDEPATTKVRKPYTITKQRERWADKEHEKFLEALKLYGRAWRRIEEHIGTKTAVQIRSHAQKFFSKLEREASIGGSAANTIEIPPPRPKRKPSHPYPRKAGMTFQNGQSAMEETSRSPQAVSPAYPFSESSLKQPNVAVTHPKGSSQLSGSQTSLKLFGQTVFLSTSQPSSSPDIKQSKETDAKEEICGDSRSDGFPLSNWGTRENDVKHTKAVPFVIASEKLAAKSSGKAKAAPLEREMGFSDSNSSTLEGTDESDIEIPYKPKGLQPPQPNLKEQGNSRFDKRSPCSSRNNFQLGSVPLRVAVQQVQKEGTVTPDVNSDTQLLDPPTYQWMENYLRSQILASNYTDCFTSLLGSSAPGPSGSTIAPWQFFQATGINHPAAYGSGMTTISLPGIIPGTRTLMMPEQGAASVSEFFADSGTAATAAATLAAASAWWALQGVAPAGIVHAVPGAIYGSTQVPVSAHVPISAVTSSRPSLYRDGVKIGHPDEGEQGSKPDSAKVDGDSTMSDDVCESADPENAYCKRKRGFHPSDLHGVHRPFEYSSRSETPFVTSLYSISTSGSQATDRAETGGEQTQRSPTISADEGDEDEKRKGGGFSSGSITPLSRHPDIPNSPENDLSGSNICLRKPHISHGASENADSSFNVEGCVYGLNQKLKEDQKIREIQQGASHNNGRHDITLNGNGCPKMRFKNREKLEKCQLKNMHLIDGESGNRKRLKSCASDEEKWKEVSDEGRKSFEAFLSCEGDASAVQFQNTFGDSGNEGKIN